MAQTSTAETTQVQQLLNSVATVLSTVGLYSGETAVANQPADLERPPGRRDISRIIHWPAIFRRLLKTHLFRKSFPDYLLDIN